MEDKELLQQLDGVGEQTSSDLLDHFGSGRKVAQSACRGWGELMEVRGISEEKAQSMFDEMIEAGVFYDLRGY